MISKIEIEEKRTHESQMLAVGTTSTLPEFALFLELLASWDLTDLTNVAPPSLRAILTVL